jgi:hypothetical protein
MRALVVERSVVMLLMFFLAQASGSALQSTKPGAWRLPQHHAGHWQCP